jgi:hypothetical protein
MKELIKALEAIKEEAGSHTVSKGQKTGFAKIYDIAKEALDKYKEPPYIQKYYEDGWHSIVN